MIWVDFFLQVFVHALAWCLAVVVALAIASAGLHLVLRPLFGTAR